MHLEEEQIQRLLHGELPREGEISAQVHLDDCFECRALFAEATTADAEVQTLLRLVDHPVPPVDVESVFRRANAAKSRWLASAAGILLALGLSTAAYAFPGSPLPALVRAVAARLRPAPTAESVTPPPTIAPIEDIAGIAITPGRSLVILFTTTQATGQARISLTADSQVVVRAPRGAAIFSSEENRLVIDNRGSTASFELQIPRGASRVEIRLAGTRIFLKQGSRIEPEDLASPSDSYLLPLTP